MSTGPPLGSKVKHLTSVRCVDMKYRNIRGTWMIHWILFYVTTTIIGWITMTYILLLCIFKLSSGFKPSTLLTGFNLFKFQVATWILASFIFSDSSLFYVTLLDVYSTWGREKPERSNQIKCLHGDYELIFMFRLRVTTLIPVWFTRSALIEVVTCSFFVLASILM